MVLETSGVFLSEPWPVTVTLCALVILKPYENVIERLPKSYLYLSRQRAKVKESSGPSLQITSWSPLFAIVKKGDEAVVCVCGYVCV